MAGKASTRSARAGRNRRSRPLRWKGLSPAAVAEDQRRRILAAVPVAVARLGYERLTVESIIGFAKVSRRTFYDMFENKADALATAHEEALSQLCDRIGAACEKELSWPRRIEVAVATALEWTATNPDRAFMIVCPASSVPGGPHGHDRLLESLAPVLRQGRPPGAGEPAASRERFLISGVASVVASRIGSHDAASLPALAPQLTAFVLPYLGLGSEEKAPAGARGRAGSAGRPRR